MDEAAPQAAPGRVKPAANQAIEDLEWDWGEAYLIGYDDERGWWASRRDQIGGLLTAGSADELRQMIRVDYNVKPVPRVVTADESSDAGELRDRI